MYTLKQSETDLRITINTQWGRLTLASYTCEPFAVNHPNRKTENGQLYFGTAKGIEVFNEQGKLIAEYWFDERHINVMRIDETHTDDVVMQKDLFNFIHSYHNKLKYSNPLYGDYEVTGSRLTDTGKGGNICLYVHVFFDYLVGELRKSKINSVINANE